MSKEASEWVSLKDAAAILGVHPTTVRNWADRGDLPSRRTPGGHRRFKRSDLQRWLATHQAAPPPAEAQVIIHTALGRARMMISEGNMSQLSWYESFDEGGKVQMRTIGRRLLELLQTYLAHLQEDEVTLEAVRQMGMDYAQTLIERGLTLTEALEGFMFFSDFLLEAVLNVFELGGMRPASESIILLRRIRAFTNAMLFSMAGIYETQS